jgi:hypothetical protein
MSNYTIYTSIGWDTRDGLTTGATGKTISGTDFHNEFTAIATAVSSKADIAGPALTGIPTAPTAAADTNTAQIATTQYVQTEMSGVDTKQNIIDAIYPVGSLYTTTISTSPAAALGGTWDAFGEGKVLVGKAGSGTFDTAGATGGREDSVLPEHTHGTNIRNEYNSVHVDSTGSSYSTGNSNDGVTGGNGYTALTDEAGVALTGNENLQPYVVVYMWKRTA